MQVIMKKDASPKAIGGVIMLMEGRDCRPHVIKNEERVHICLPAIHDEEVVRKLGGMPGVEEVKLFSNPFRLVSREFRREDTVVDVDGVLIGSRKFILIAGPCAVESRDQLFEAAAVVKQAGAVILRGGAFKPRTSPYSFRGLQSEGLKLLAEAGKRFGIKIITEIVSPEHLDEVYEAADILQVGARNMQNFSLLEKLAGIRKPVLLKRGMMSTIEELLMSAEYLMNGGNPHVVLCERGIRTFERRTRNTLDISAVPVLKDITHLPVIVDPSHAVGDSRYVERLSLAAAAAGADGVMVEVHPCPESARCDGKQSLTPGQFSQLTARLKKVAVAVGRDLDTGLKMPCSPGMIAGNDQV